MNNPQDDADPFGWFAQLALGHQQFATFMRSTLEVAPLDERSKAQWSFALRQVVDAMSPKNALATNPEVLQLALQSGGAIPPATYASGRTASRAASAIRAAAAAISSHRSARPTSASFDGLVQKLFDVITSTPSCR